MNDYQKAVDDLTKAIELKTDNPNAYTGRGVFQYRLNQIEKVCLDFHKAKELGDPKAQMYIHKYCTKKSL